MLILSLEKSPPSHDARFRSEVDRTHCSVFMSCLPVRWHSEAFTSLLIILYKDIQERELQNHFRKQREQWDKCAHRKGRILKMIKGNGLCTLIGFLKNLNTIYFNHISYLCSLGPKCAYRVTYSISCSNQKICEVE